MMAPPISPAARPPQPQPPQPQHLASAFVGFAMAATETAAATEIVVRILRMVCSRSCVLLPSERSPHPFSETSRSDLQSHRRPRRVFRFWPPRYPPGPGPGGFLAADNPPP